MCYGEGVHHAYWVLRYTLDMCGKSCDVNMCVIAEMYSWAARASCMYSGLKAVEIMVYVSKIEQNN